MQSLNIPALRLTHQHLSRPDFKRPEEVVSWFGAVQSQDYAAGKWALGLRLEAASDELVEQAFNQGRLLRTHTLRPTWHFVTPEDICWILALTSPRVQAHNAYAYRRAEVDTGMFKRSETVIRKALRGGNFLTRAELSKVLEKAGITSVELRFTYLIMHAELEGILCSGPRNGKQFTYALLEERAPGAKSLPPERALAELIRRYFTSHGPATLQDFCWWSSLTMAQARAGIEAAGRQLASASIEGRTYWFIDDQARLKQNVAKAILLPNFDEYIVGYTDRIDVFDPRHDEGLIPRNSMLSRHTILLNGQVAGTWKRSLSKDTVQVEPSGFSPLKAPQKQATRRAAERYAAFLGLKLELQ